MNDRFENMHLLVSKQQIPVMIILLTSQFG